MEQDTVSRVASCVEYNSADDEEVVSTKRLAAREQANVAAKRTTDTPGSTSPPHQKHQDLASDSGYSSRTRATSASADSGQSATAPATDMPASSSQPQANQVPSGASSHKSRSTKKKCTDPNCPTCLAARKKKTLDKPPPERPPSPNAKRSSEKAAPPAAAAAPNAAQTRPLRSASSSRVRPRSMYSGYLDPSFGTAYFPHQGFPYGGNRAAYMTGPGNVVYPERPGMPHRATDTAAYSARRRPLSMAGTPLVSYDPAATHRVSARRPTKNANEASVSFVQDNESDEAEYDEESDDIEEQIAAVSDEARRVAIENQQMRAQLKALRLQAAENEKKQTQPSFPPQQQQPAPSSGPKYSMRTYDKAATKITYGTPNGFDHDGVRNVQRGMNTNGLPGGFPWERRQSFASSADHTRASAYPQPAGNNPRVTAGDPNWAPRRMSYMNGESLDEARARRRELENMLANHQAEGPQSPTMQDNMALDPETFEQLVASMQNRKAPVLESQIQEALKYQAQMDGLRHRVGHAGSTPLTARILRNHTGVPAEAELHSASRSNASNDGSGRISAGHRIKQAPEPDEFRARIDLSRGFEAEVGGRRFAVNPTGEESIADVFIGVRREPTLDHGTSKGSVTAESRLGRSTSVREKAARRAERDRERERERERERRRERSRQHEEVVYEDDDLSSTSSSDHPPPHRIRTRRETFTGRRAAEEQSDTERPKRGHRRMKTTDARYAAGPSSPTRGRGRRNVRN